MACRRHVQRFALDADAGVAASPGCNAPTVTVPVDCASRAAKYFVGFSSAGLNLPRLEGMPAPPG
jgi:hypothetical protein